MSSTPTTTPPPRASFCGLPAELRLCIYEFAMTPKYSEKGGHNFCNKGLYENDQIHPLTHVNRLMRHEFLPLLRSRLGLWLEWDLNILEWFFDFPGKAWLDTFGDAILPYVRFIYMFHDSFIWQIRLDPQHPSDPDMEQHMTAFNTCICDRPHNFRLPDPGQTSCDGVNRTPKKYEKHGLVSRLFEDHTCTGDSKCWKCNIIRDYAGDRAKELNEAVVKALEAALLEQPNHHLTTEDVKRFMGAIEWSPPDYEPYSETHE